MTDDATQTGGSPEHFRWEDYRRRPKWFTHDGGFGGLRATFPNVESENMWGHVAWAPKGQRAPWHAAAPGSTQRIYLGLVGEVDFLMVGQRLPLGPLDTLVFADAPYAFENFGERDALFWVLSRRHGPSPPQAAARGTTYFAEEPPVDPTAAEKVSLLPWNDHARLLRWQSPPGEPWGRQWGAYPWIELDSGVHGRMLRLPPGNARGSHTVARDTFLLGLVGEVEASVGRRSFDLMPRDVVVVPAGADVAISNIAFEDALLFEVTPGS